MPIASRRLVYDGIDRGVIWSWGRAGGVLSTVLLVTCQLLALWALYLAGTWLVATLDLPIPGNLVGLVSLYALLSLGIVKAAWLEPLASRLIKHLAFFFIPVTVGLMDVAGFLLSHAVAIAMALLASAVVGILLAGLVSQTLIDKPREGEDP
jgi:holin-like protein